ncbi:hypothetical protein [Aliiroseovarius crassostreae]|uniref:hypothetical protein n=1 Tax=Aliiroseovarius crassostreae TaxID=154981 RepID=UPI003C7C4FDA
MYDKLQYLFAIIAVVVTPTVSMLTYYAATGDPTLRPLAASVKQLRGYFAGGDDILVEVHWGSDASGPQTQDDVEKILRSAFLSKGIDAHVVFRNVNGSRFIHVTYKVGVSEFGPMRLTETPRVVQSVVAAYRMGKRS